MLSLNIQFNNLEEMRNFLESNSNKENIKIKKEKKVGDKRGANIKQLHQKAKEYHLLHPNESYKNCLKLCNINNTEIKEEKENIDSNKQD